MMMGRKDQLALLLASTKAAMGELSRIEAVMMPFAAEISTANVSRPANGMIR
jgi:hypothetical protein